MMEYHAKRAQMQSHVYSEYHTRRNPTLIRQRLIPDPILHTSRRLKWRVGLCQCVLASQKSGIAGCRPVDRQHGL